MEQTTLQLIFDTQEKFQGRFGFNKENMTVRELSKFIHEHADFVVEETFEMLRELPFHKPWKDYSDLTEDEVQLKIQRAREEWIDILHFVANTGLALGFDEGLVRKMYIEKNKLNIQRQEDPDLGYVK